MIEWPAWVMHLYRVLLVYIYFINFMNFQSTVHVPLLLSHIFQSDIIGLGVCVWCAPSSGERGNAEPRGSCGDGAQPSVFQGEGEVALYERRHRRCVHHLLDTVPGRLHRPHVRRHGRRRAPLRPLDLHVLWIFYKHRYVLWIFFFGMANSMINPLIYGAFHSCRCFRSRPNSGVGVGVAVAVGGAVPPVRWVRPFLPLLLEYIVTSHLFCELEGKGKGSWTFV